MIIFGNRGHYSAIGGVENSLRGMLNVVSERQQQATLVCREPLINESLDIASLDLGSGIDLVLYRDEFNQNPFKRLLSLRHGGKALLKAYCNVYARFPDAILIVRHHMHVLAAARAGFRDIRYLVPSLTTNQLRQELSGTPYSRKLTILLHMLVDGWLQSRALTMAQLFVFSESMQRQVRHGLRGPFKDNPIKLVRPGIDSLRFMPATDRKKQQLRVQLGLPLGKKLFLFVGRFVQAKGLDYLIDAFGRLSPEYSLVFVGEGEREPSIRDSIRTLGLGNRVFIVGRTSKVEDFYRACDVFVMSSIYEPLGQTILEAAACGIRIAAYGPNSGVDTATHELGLDGIIDYANELDGESLANSMMKAMEAQIEKAPAYNSKFSTSSNSWATLLDRLTE